MKPIVSAVLGALIAFVTLGCGTSHGLNSEKVDAALKNVPYRLEVHHEADGLLVGKASDASGAYDNFAVVVCDGQCGSSANLKGAVPNAEPGNASFGSNWGYLGEAGQQPGLTRRQSNTALRMDATIYVALCEAANDPGSCV